VIKVCTNSYVFKFVGGETHQRRSCYYCRKRKKGGMICIYGNTEAATEDTIFVCPACAVRGCKESEDAWKKIEKMAATIKKKVLAKEGHRGR
jgi:hypothetical protein